MRYLYAVMKEKLSFPERNSLVTFGIRAFECDGAGKRCLIFSVSDISTNRLFVEKLAARCTEEQVEPVHFYCIWEDFLAEVGYRRIFGFSSDGMGRRSSLAAVSEGTTGNVNLECSGRSQNPRPYKKQGNCRIWDKVFACHIFFESPYYGIRNLPGFSISM